MPLLYLVMENANNINLATGSHPSAYIDTISIAEDLGNGQYRPNLSTNHQWNTKVISIKETRMPLTSFSIFLRKMGFI